MESWRKYFDEANAYSKTAFGSFNKSKFGSQVIYNLLSMAVENYLTALCSKIGQMPEHSGITAILRQVQKSMDIPEIFHVEARFINSFMNFCSLEVLETKDPSRSDLVRMLGFTDELKRFCEERLLQEEVA
ncbi:hypothetical protein OU798_23880 [Prolixibacteraceae bacterium Z1-6]|uniref:HEPN domain-containing protein n=1 Tax=Draconibacterium aestuarii TaxID=2998507 RepID=A0A9X3FBQ1_9BACT|nr:hypothetical protein [Prolixibacteraceae bacterium Z1-6]